MMWRIAAVIVASALATGASATAVRAPATTATSTPCGAEAVVVDTRQWAPTRRIRPRGSPYRAGRTRVFVSSGPRAGRLFTGAYLCVADPPGDPVKRLSCDATLGGTLRYDRPKGALFVVGGVRLSPVVRRRWSPPDANGLRRLAAATCGWRIPRGSEGKLLSLVHPPCSDCGAWGWHVDFASGGLTECNQSTWVVRTADAQLGPLLNDPRIPC